MATALTGFDTLGPRGLSAGLTAARDRREQLGYLLHWLLEPERLEDNGWLWSVAADDPHPGEPFYTEICHAVGDRLLWDASRITAVCETLSASYRRGVNPGPFLFDALTITLSYPKPVRGPVAEQFMSLLCCDHEPGSVPELLALARALAGKLLAAGQQVAAQLRRVEQRVEAEFHRRSLEETALRYAGGLAGAREDTTAPLLGVLAELCADGAINDLAIRRAVGERLIQLGYERPAWMPHAYEIPTLPES